MVERLHIQQPGGRSIATDSANALRRLGPKSSLVAVAAIAVGLALATIGLRTLWYEVCPVGAPAPGLRPLTDEELVTNATDVFVGRVVEQRFFDDGAVLDDAGDCVVRLPDGVYTVDVVQTIAGKTAERVEVWEGAGKIARRDRRPEDVPLKPGEAALFVTRLDPNRPAYSLLGGARGRFRIASDREREELVRRFTSVLATPRPPTSGATPMPVY